MTTHTTPVPRGVFVFALAASWCAAAIFAPAGVTAGAPGSESVTRARLANARANYLEIMRRFDQAIEEIETRIEDVYQRAEDAKRRCDKEAFTAAQMALYRAEIELRNAGQDMTIGLDGNMSVLLGLRADLAGLPVSETTFADIVESTEEVSNGRARRRERLGEVTEHLEWIIKTVLADPWGPCGDEAAANLPADPEDAALAGANLNKGDAPAYSMTYAQTETFKRDIATIDQSGKPTDGTVVEIPDDPAEDITELGDDDPIDPQKRYIVDTTCHERIVVTGHELVADRQVGLKQEERLFRFEPCNSNGRGLELAIEALARDGFRREDFKLDVETNFDRDDAGNGRWYCEVWATPWDDAPATVGCPDDETRVARDETSRGVDPPGGERRPDPDETPPTVDPADDDPSIDPPDVPPGDSTTPFVDRNTKRRAAQAAAPADGDPHFGATGTWGQAYADQWGLHRIGFSPDAPSLWPEEAEPVVVAVIDSGIDRTHPDLTGALWVNEDEIPGNGVDDDENGYVDDVFGWNFLDHDDDVTDRNGHGTVVAGIIAAWTGNGVGIAGVNPWARIMAIKVGDWQGEAWSFDLADAIRYAADNGARVINLSYEGERLSRTELLAVAYARRKGAILVVAAGNEGADVDDVSPAGLPGVITVGATDLEDRRAAFSNWGGGVDIAAPGYNILSLRARQTDPLKFWRDDYEPGSAIVGERREQYLLTGTSFSAPFVAGVASLIFSMRPELTAEQVMRMVLHSARDIETPGWDQFTGYGLLDARAALAADPGFYLLSRISGARGVKTADGFFVEVTGRARADKFRRAWIEAGPGSEPTEWIKVSDDLTQPVDSGRLALIAPRQLRGAKAWTLRLVVEHENGRRREARFTLTVG